MRTLQILYVGVESGTCLQRARALERLGHQVHILDPFRLTSASRALKGWLQETGGVGLEGYVRRRLIGALPPKSFDLVWVDGGALVGPSLVRDLRRRYRCVVNYNLDDPYGTRDKRYWRLYQKAVPEYDLVVVVRTENIQEAEARGARRVLRVFRSADEVAHGIRHLDRFDWERWGSDVLFVGAWMPERGPFFAELVRRAVPITIYGKGWDRAKEWRILRDFWRGPGLFEPEEYSKAIQCSKVCLGLLSKGNRDLHTQRSLEIPYLGRVLCAERTTEHCELYRENEEAVFWSSADECVAKCFSLLDNPDLRNSIASRGHKRCERNRTTNEAVLGHILDNALDGFHSEVELVCSSRD